MTHSNNKKTVLMKFTSKPFAVIAILTILFISLSCSDNATGPDSDEPIPFNSQAAPGDSARSFLQPDQFPIMNLEIDFMEGYEPSQDALDSLKNVLENHLNKSQINIGVPNSIPAGGQNAYSANDIWSLEEQHRDHFTETESDTVWAYFLIVDGEFTQQNVLGIAYFNTSMAFFGKTIDDISGGVGQPSQRKVEGTVFIHEFGHILGLVNNGIPMQQDHHDEANGAHCTVEECVMYHAIETSDFFSNIFDGTIPKFEQFCTEDMAAAGSQ